MVPTAMVFKAKLWTQLATIFKRTIRKGTPFKQTVVAAVLFMGLAAWCCERAVHEVSALAGQADTARQSSQESSESWRTEFDNICAKTEDAMTFSQEELTDLIRRCDSLQPQIEKLDESRKKVYLERLRKCRGLYAYVLDAKKKDKK